MSNGAEERTGLRPRYRRAFGCVTWVYMGMLVFLAANFLLVLPSRYLGSGELYGYLPPTLAYLGTLLILPGMVLASVYLGLVTRMTRSTMLEVLATDYVRTARGKGLGQRAVIYRHALRNALIPTITVLGLAFGDILAGTVLTETIFSWPGIGRYAYQSAVTLDFPAIMGVSLLIAGVFITVNLLTDLAYVFFDPRLRTVN